MNDKPLVWLYGEVKSPPFSDKARIEAGHWLRKLQKGHHLDMPVSRPMPSIDTRCHELRIKDSTINWRIVYRIDPDAIIIVDVFKKKTRKTPIRIIDRCKRRLKSYDSLMN